MEMKRKERKANDRKAKQKQTEKIKRSEGK